MMTSVVAVVPTEDRAAANAVLASHGHGPDNFSTGFSPDGTAPATHWAFRHSDPAIIAHDLPGSVLTSYAQDASGHLVATMQALNLQRVEHQDGLGSVQA
jgi:hypothetical protein